MHKTRKRSHRAKALRREGDASAARRVILFPAAAELASDVGRIAAACAGEVVSEPVPHAWPASMPPCPLCGFPGHDAERCPLA